MKLSPAQIKRLRTDGNRRRLKPVVTIGQKGLGDNLHAEIDAALAHHELIKLRIPSLDRDGKRELAEEICDRHDAVLVQAIGSVIVIFRRNPESDRFDSLIDD